MSNQNYSLRAAYKNYLNSQDYLYKYDSLYEIASEALTAKQ